MENVAFLTGDSTTLDGQVFTDDSDQFRFFRSSSPTPTGTSSASLTPGAIAKNAIVNKYDLQVTAIGNVYASLTSVGQVRKTQDFTSGSSRFIGIVVDFGTPVTVDQVALSSAIPSFVCYRVTPWSGAQFNRFSPAFQALFSADQGGPPASAQAVTTEDNVSTSTLSVFTSESKTERLLIELVTDSPSDVDAAATSLFDEVLVHLPAAPGDLTLRLNGGAAIWTFPGPVPLKPGANSLDPPSWQQTVSVAPALAALTGKADDATPLDLNFTLTAGQPGLIQLQSGAGGTDVGYLQTVANIGPDGVATLAYASEGPAPKFTIQLPPTAHGLDQLSFTLAGNLPPERVLPPISPGTVPASAKLVLDGNHSACALLSSALGGAPNPLVELVGVRLPLRADPGGAEVRAQLWSVGDGKSGENGEPNAPIDGGTSQPVTLAAPGADDDGTYTFVTLAFPKPVKLPADPAPLPFVALLVTRGRVSWNFATPDATVAANATAGASMRVGAPTGPWRVLPALFNSDSPSTTFATLRPALRLIGHTAHETPLAPLALSLRCGTSQLVGGIPLTPTAKGVPVTVSAPATGPLPLANPTVSVDLPSYVAGSVTIKDMQVVFHTSDGAPPSTPAANRSDSG